MNTEDFENQLRRARMREVPAEWREEVLGKMRAEGGSASSRPAGTMPGRERAVSWWRDLLWPSPLAWAALACIWCGILVSGGHSRQTPPAATISADTLMMRLEQERMLAENRGMQGL